ncbi:glycosyltransferase family 2 protein [Bacteroides sp.]
MEMLISIITVALNSAKTVEDTIRSVLFQTYSNIEYIIIDGGSKDKTLSIIQKYAPLFDERLKYVSEPDLGIYDAMNKGLGIATGDIVGFLNSDDYFENIDVLESVAAAFEKKETDAVFGNVLYVKNSGRKIVRRYSGKHFRPWQLRYGMMPPHPSFYMKRQCYVNGGGYRTDFLISGDYELILRYFLRKNISYQYLDLDMVVMRLGGASTRSFISILSNNSLELIEACRMNDIYTNWFMILFRFCIKIGGVLKWLLIPYYIRKNDN